MSEPLQPPANDASVERQLERLEAIVEELSGDGIELDAALQLFEEGVARLRAVTARLAAAESRVKVLSEEADGSFVLEDLDD
jgi:exodeoxyribonuclease VII small subunit